MTSSAAGHPPSATQISSDIPALCRGPAPVSVRHLPAADAATLLDGFGLTIPRRARRGPSRPPSMAYLTTGRVVGTVAALVALAGVSADCGGRRRGWSRHWLRDRRRLCGSHPRPDSGEARGGTPCMASRRRLSGCGDRHRDAGHDGDRPGDAVLTELGPDQCGQRVEVGRTAAIQDDKRHSLAAPLVRGTGHGVLATSGCPMSTCSIGSHHHRPAS